jgi:hypothetical protein
MTVRDDVAFGSHFHRKRASRIQEVSQHIKTVRCDMPDDKHRRRQVGREIGKETLQGVQCAG